MSSGLGCSEEDCKNENFSVVDEDTHSGGDGRPLLWEEVHDQCLRGVHHSDD